MKSNKNIVYFVLYLVILTELLIVITERDELEEVEHQIRDKMLATLAQMYKQPLILSIPQKESTYDLNSKNQMRVALTPNGLVTEEEKEKLRFYIDIDPKSKGKPRNWPDGGVSPNVYNDFFKLEYDKGNAVFIAKLDREGEYIFRAFCEVERELPTYLPDYLLDSLKTMIGELKTARSDTEFFSITAKSTDGVNRKQAEISY